MSIIYNFSAGPAVLPKEVLQRAQQEMLDWHGRGMSVMEMSHRGEEFMSIIAKTESDLRELVGIPNHYKILFLQGGASSQFAMVPMNLLRGKKKQIMSIRVNGLKRLSTRPGNIAKLILPLRLKMHVLPMPPPLKAG